MPHPKAVITLAAIAAFPAFVLFTKENFKDTTNLKIDVKAEGYLQVGEQNSWTLGKFNEPDSIQLRTGQKGTISYKLTATRESIPGDTFQGVKGEVCIKNIGKQATDGLQVINQVQEQTFLIFKDIPGANQTLNPEQLQPQQQSCLPYTIAFSPTAGSQKFRVVSKATIKNQSGKSRHEIAKKDTDQFIFPQTTTSGTNASATITDIVECPSGYDCQASDPGPWTITDTKEINYTLAVTNESADCSEPVGLGNTATLVESVTQNKVSSSETVVLNSPPCSN